MKAKRILSAAAWAALFGCCSVSMSAELSREDRQFIEKAARSGTKEADVSSSALPRLTAPAVREYAQMLVAHRAQVYEELKALAARKGVTLPPKDEAIAQTWSRSEKDVAHDYLDEMVGEQQETVRLFGKAGESSDPDVVAFAQRTLPKLRQHLELAQTYQKSN